MYPLLFWSGVRYRLYLLYLEPIGPKTVHSVSAVTCVWNRAGYNIQGRYNVSLSIYPHGLYLLSPVVIITIGTIGTIGGTIGALSEHYRSTIG
jgi:hypothetical protein